MCLELANTSLKSVGTTDRSFYAGKCIGIEECINIDREI